MPSVLVDLAGIRQHDRSESSFGSILSEDDFGPGETSAAISVGVCATHRRTPGLSLEDLGATASPKYGDPMRLGGPEFVGAHAYVYENVEIRI